MKSVPRFLRCPYRITMRVALEEINTEDLLRQERGWKLFMLLPRMLLHRPPRGGVVERGKLLKRFDQFNRGAWTSLVEASRTCCQQAAVVRRRRSRRGENDLGRRVDRAEALVHMGELSSARARPSLATTAFGQQLFLVWPRPGLATT